MKGSNLKKALLIIILAVFLTACSGNNINYEETQEALEELEEELKETEEALEATEEYLEEMMAEPEVAATMAAPVLQWATGAAAGSEYDNPDNAAIQALGEPDTLECGDHETAWASADGYGIDWLELTYDTPVIASEIIVYQSHTPNQIVEVEVIDLDGGYHSVYTNTPALTNDCPYENTITVSLDFPVNAVRITIDQSVIPATWDEIDAVALIGLPLGGGEEVSAGGGDDVADVDDVAEEGEDTAAGCYGRADFAFVPEDAAAGSFFYTVVGDDADADVAGSYIQWQSTPNEYIIGLSGDDFRHAVTLFLPLELSELDNCGIDLPPYPEDAFATKAPHLAMFARWSFYYPTFGKLFVTDNGDGTVSGSFSFTAEHQDDPSRVLEIHGAFNSISLVETP